MLEVCPLQGYVSFLHTVGKWSLLFWYSSYRNVKEGIMESIMKIMVAFAGWFWGPPILILIGGGGIWCTLQLKALQLTRFPYVCSQTFGKMFSKPKTDDPNAVSPFSAAVAALASSIGASNIIGVPVAIAYGGPGAVFWMWILAILGCATKFVEIVLGVHYRETNEKGEHSGGPFYYCAKGLGELGLGGIGKFFGYWFAFLLMIEIAPSISTQGASIVQNVVTLLPQSIQENPAQLQNFKIGIIAALVIVVLLVVVGGFKRIASVTDKLVPLMAGIYIVAALGIIALNIANIPVVLGNIFAGAFTGHAATGAFAGTTVKLALRWGAARGVYSNEAGMGTAPIAHSTATVDHPVRQGLWAIFEVVVDTLIVCTVTALTVLVSGAWTAVEPANAGGMPSMAFRAVYGSAGDALVTICVILFVLSTIIVITFYGEKQAEFLFGTKFAKYWKFVYIVAIVGGLYPDLGTLFDITDVFLALIIIPNMIAVIALAPKVRELAKEYFNTPGKYYLADVAAKKQK